MAQFFLDNFTDSDGTNLGLHTPDTGTGWTNHPTLNGSATGAIQTNRHYGGTTGALWFIDDAPASADYRVGCQTYLTGLGTTAAGVYLYSRLSTTANTGYWFRSYESGTPSGQLELGKTVAGTNTSLGTLSASYGTYAALNMELEVEGTSIRAYAQIVSSGLWIQGNGSTSASRVACFNVTDSSVTAVGRPGINATNSSSTTRTHVESFFAETLTNEFTESVTTNISFTQDGFRGQAEEADNTLLLSSGITFFNVENDREVPESILSLTQSVQVEGLIQQAVSTLALTSQATAFLLGEFPLESNLALSSNASVVFGVPHSAPWGVAGVEQTLDLQSTFAAQRPVSASTTISFSQEVEVSYGLESELNLVQSVVAGIGHDIDQDLGISQTVARGGSEWNRSTSSTMVMTSSSNGWNGNDACFRRYGNASGPTQSGTLTLFSSDGLYSVVLRNPETDNIRRTAYDRILRETRGGNLIVYRDPTWNVVQTLLFTIVALKRTTLDDLQTFFLNTLGQEIILVDWLGEEWSGVVTRPDETFTEDRDGYWTFAFEFEGTKLQGEGSYQNLNLTQQASATVVP